MTKRVKRRKFTPEPTDKSTPEGRGQMLRHWLDVKDLPIDDFAEAIQIGRATLNRYLSGKRDLATVSQEIADKLLTGMGIPDSEAWALLGIPVENRSTFRSFREPPYGHGGKIQQILSFTLTEPMFGEPPLPEGAVITVDPNDTSRRYRVIRLSDGRLYSARPEMAQRADGVIMGSLVSATF